MAFWSTYQSEQNVVDRLKALSFGKAAIGTYTGDAAATKAITGVGFSPKAVIIYEMVTNKNIILKSTFDGTKSFVQPNGGASLYVDDQVISLDTDGFTVGDGSVNSNCSN